MGAFFSSRGLNAYSNPSKVTLRPGLAEGNCVFLYPIIPNLYPGAWKVDRPGHDPCQKSHQAHVSSIMWYCTMRFLATKVSNSNLHPTDTSQVCYSCKYITWNSASCHHLWLQMCNKRLQLDLRGSGWAKQIYNSVHRESRCMKSLISHSPCRRS